METKKGKFKLKDGCTVACSVCMRGFESEALLRRHEEQSELHRKNVAALGAASRGASSGRSAKAFPAASSSRENDERPNELMAGGDCAGHCKGMMTRKAVAAMCPPWSMPYCSSVRSQAGTLKWKLHEMPLELVQAQRRLDMRRHQPSSGDHGLAFRLKDAHVPHEFTEAGYAAKQARPSVDPDATKTAMEYPKWWGEAGTQEASRPTYEDFGSGYEKQVPFGRRELLRTTSLPLIHSKYEHENPFKGQFVKRLHCGLVANDVSVANKPGEVSSALLVTACGKYKLAPNRNN